MDSTRANGLPGLRGVEHIGLTVPDPETAISLCGRSRRRRVYFLAAWGLQLELVSAPNGPAYEKSGGRPMRRPGADNDA